MTETPAGSITRLRRIDFPSCMLVEPPSWTPTDDREVKGIGDVVLVRGQDGAILLAVVDLPDRQQQLASTDAQPLSHGAVGPYRPKSRDPVIDHDAEIFL